MFDMITTSSPWDDMWRTMDALMQYPSINKGHSIEKTGLKSLISRPHNIITIKNKDGVAVAQRLEVVTTPFKKDDVKVSVKGNVLSVECGSKVEIEPEEKPTEDETDHYIYQGISSQNYRFSVKLGDNIDKANIKAKNQDGMLAITLPFIKEEDKKEDTTEITVE